MFLPRHFPPSNPNSDHGVRDRYYVYSVPKGNLLVRDILYPTLGRRQRWIRTYHSLQLEQTGMYARAILRHIDTNLSRRRTLDIEPARQVCGDDDGVSDGSTPISTFWEPNLYRAKNYI